jgi:LmbE family N-acetylglucosaminyl deacetylase
MTDASAQPALSGTILSIWAHPDDETYLAAAVMADARDRGQRVVCAIATAGERGTEDPEEWPPERLGRVRRWEALAAMAVLGVDEHHILGLPDGALPEHEERGLAWARGLLDEVQPDIVLTFGPEGMTYHPDHIAVHRWVTQAWRDHGEAARLLQATSSVEQLERFREKYEDWGVFMRDDERPSGVPKDELAVHLLLDGTALDRKLTALRAMASQTGDLWRSLGPETYAALIAEEAFVEATPVGGRTG